MTMRPVDIERLVSLSRPSVAPDGSFAVFATSRPDLAANRAVGQLWRAELGDGPVRRLTRGVADAAPQVSPDGAHVAFLRGDTKGRMQIHVVAAGGGEPIAVTDAALGVSDFAWSPDASLLAFTARVAEAGRYGTVDGLEATAEAPRHITGIRWEANGLGYVADRPSQLFLVDAPDLQAEPAYASAPTAAGAGTPATPVPAHARQITAGPVGHIGAVFTHDGGAVLTVVDAIERDHRDLRQELVAVAIADGAVTTVLSREANLSISAAAVAADGTIAVLAYDVGPDGVDFVAPGTGLWLIEDGAPRQLTDPETIDLGEVGSSIVAVGEDFLVQHRARGREIVLAVTRGGEVREVLGGDVEATGIDATVTDDGIRLVAAVATAASFGELVVVDATGERTLTTFGTPLAELGIVRPTELSIAGRDGTRVHGWLATPEGAGPFPTILMIHGGPYASYGIHVFDEVQTLVDAGYAVAYCNPRGSAGYGREHGRTIRGRMGTVDFDDVIDFLDGAVASDTRLDGSRVGVMGGSYGGYLTAWVIAHDHRFAGAIVERGFLEPASFQGTSDIGSFFGDQYVGTDPADIARQSPFAHVGDVRTPTFVVHSERDLRCPLEQSTRYYTALKRAGVDAEMLIFPGENHELTRSGQPRHRVERFTAILDWWSRHLPTD